MIIIFEKNFIFRQEKQKQRLCSLEILKTSFYFFIWCNFYFLIVLFCFETMLRQDCI